MPAVRDPAETTMPTSPAPHRLAILALPGFVPFDLAIPQALFAQTRLPDGGRPYEVVLCGPHDPVRSEEHVLNGVAPLARLVEADTVVIPGILEPEAFDDAAVCRALRRAAAAGGRLASICTGAFVLAAAGLLDGLPATTHWAKTADLARLYPKIAVQADVLFVDNGAVLTSAGLASGLDLCLHLIRQDLGAAAAERCAQFFVLPLERDGGCAQRLRRLAPGSDDSLAALQIWLLENLHVDLTLDAMAEQARLSPRTLHRRFREQLGAAPMDWLARARVRRAQALLETTTLGVEAVAAAVGFGSAAAFRERFRRLVGVSPTAWRETYGAGTGQVR